MHQKRTISAVLAAQQTRDTSKALREKKKLEAMERSKARQAQKDYFKTKKEANVAPDKDQETDYSKADHDDEEHEESTGNVEDPFRVGPSRGSKVHVR